MKQLLGILFLCTVCSLLPSTARAECSITVSGNTSSLTWTAINRTIPIDVTYSGCSTNEAIVVNAGFGAGAGTVQRQSSNLPISVAQYTNGARVVVGFPAKIPTNGQQNGANVCTSTNTAWNCTIAIYARNASSNAESNTIDINYSISKSNHETFNTDSKYQSFSFASPVSLSGTNTGSPSTTNTGSSDASTGSVLTETVSGNSGFSKLPNPLGGAGIVTIGDGISKVVNLIMIIALPFVTIMIIYSGFLFIAAYGNPEKLKKARQTILWTLVGTVILMGATTIGTAIVKTVQKIGQTDGTPSTGDTQNTTGQNSSTGSNTQNPQLPPTNTTQNTTTTPPPANTASTVDTTGTIDTINELQAVIIENSTMTASQASDILMTSANLNQLQANPSLLQTIANQIWIARGGTTALLSNAQVAQIIESVLSGTTTSGSTTSTNTGNTDQTTTQNANRGQFIEDYTTPKGNAFKLYIIVGTTNHRVDAYSTTNEQIKGQDYPIASKTVQQLANEMKLTILPALGY